MRLTGIAFMLLFISLIIFAGCSSSNNTPLSPDTPNEFPASEQNADNSNLLGMWDAEFDIENNTVKINPHRGIDAHFNITLLIPGPQIDILSFDPTEGIVEAEITIENPYAFDAYDIRMIIYTDTLGHMLMNPDGWTDLYENPGGLPINPFKAFNKSETNRVFAGLSNATETLLIYLPGGNPNVTFALEGSFPSNCEEPYKMENFSHGNLYNTVGSNAQMQVDVFDWQNNVQSVFLYCPVITGVTTVPLSFDSGNTWTGTITNANGVGVGAYTGYVIGYSSGISLYDQVSIYVGEEATEPGWVQSWGAVEADYSRKICCQGDSLFVAGIFNRTVDFDPGPQVVPATSNGGYDVYVVKYTDAGTFHWVKTWGGAGYDGTYGVAVDASGNIYVSGFFRETVDFDPGVGVVEATSAGMADSYILKLDPSGNFLWVNTWGGEMNNFVDCLTVSNSIIFASGRFSGTADFDPGPGILNRTSNGYDDVWLSSFDLDGNLLNNGTFGGELSEMPYGIAANQANEVFLAGLFKETVDFDFGAGIYEGTSNGGYDGFIVEYNSSLEFQSLKTFGGTETDYSTDITVDSQGNIIVAGLFKDEVDFDPSTGEDFHISNGDSDVFISKYDSAGNYIFTKTYGYINSDITPLITTDNANNIIINSSFNSTCDFDPGPGVVEKTSLGESDIYILKLDTTGEFTWIYTAGSTRYEQGYGAVTDESGYIYSIGGFFDTMDFEPGSGITERTSNGSYDAFLLKLNPSGEW